MTLFDMHLGLLIVREEVPRTSYNFYSPEGVSVAVQPVRGRSRINHPPEHILAR